MPKTKFVFILNPHAGKGNQMQKIRTQAAACCEEHGFPYEFYETTCAGDATAFTAAYPEKDVCFVACGGDGTLNEVAAGIAKREDGFLGHYPCGSGNDFTRTFGEKAKHFLDFSDQLFGAPCQADMLECDGEVCVNMLNIGFDSKVAANMADYKKLPMVSGSMAYILSLLMNIAGKLCRKMRVQLDTGEVFEEPFTLSVAANGVACGGGFKAAPKATVFDGMLDFCGVRKISKLQVASLIGKYKAGQHLDDPAFDQIVIFRRCRTVTFTGIDEKLIVCKDGEVSYRDTVTVGVSDKKLRLWLPRGVAAPEDRKL